MIYLVLCIISSSLLMVVFKELGRRNIDSYKVIVINYIAASLLGFLISGFPSKNIFGSEWLPFAVIIGILFIVVFLLMAYSTRTAGIALTTIVVKMSVIIPISFSIIYFREDISFLKISGIVLAIIAVYLTAYKKADKGLKGITIIIIPLLLFLGSGIIDSLIKYTQETWLNAGSSIMFSSVLFLIAAVAGISYSPFRKITLKSYFRKEILITGTILGVLNFGSLYGIVMTLDSRIFDSSIIFGINNMGIVVLSLAMAFILYSEKLTTRNRIGVMLSVITIIFLSLV